MKYEGVAWRHHEKRFTLFLPRPWGEFVAVIKPLEYIDTKEIVYYAGVAVFYYHGDVDQIIGQRTTAVASGMCNTLFDAQELVYAFVQKYDKRYGSA